MAKRKWRENRKAHAQFICVICSCSSIIYKAKEHNIGKKDKHGIHKA